LDLAVETLLGAGALGARMTGGGFGGSVVALLPATAVDRAIEAATTAFAARGFTDPQPRLVRPAPGARRDDATGGAGRVTG
jgi:galactokinase